MKAVLIFTACIAACVLVAGCAKHDNTESAASEEPVATPVPAATPEPVKVVVLATPAPKRLAPDGVFFLLAKKSVETPDGIFGLAPGTKVVRQPDGKYVADGHTLELQASEITNDLDVAASYAGADARAQAAIRQALQAHGVATAPASSAKTASSAPASTSAAASVATASSTVVPGTQRSGGTLLDGPTSLGSAHSKVQNGWLYEKDAAGNWVQVKQVR